MSLARLSDEALLASLTNVCFEMHRLLGRLLVHLIEVEQRRLDLRSACSSLYDFCTRRLGMSESEACRRIEAARLVKRFPCLLEAIERGDMHLTGLLLLRDHFTTDNVDELVATAKGRTKREILELIAARAPKPDILPTITPLPAVAPPASSSSQEPAPPARLEPLSPSRHRLELTVSSEIRAKLERARDLLGHRVPSGNLESVIDTALDALLAKLQKERSGKGIPREVRREVFHRDGERCTYTDDKNHRCESRVRLEIDHRVPRARDGSSDKANLRVMCRAHNRLLAEQAFGREHVGQQIHLRQRRNVHPVASQALVKMGFRAREVQRVLEDIPESDALPLPELVRSALRRLVT